VRDKPSSRPKRMAIRMVAAELCAGNSGRVVVCPSIRVADRTKRKVNNIVRL
jgi:hypothetical protein